MSFDCNPSLEVRSVYLDILKTFDKVRHRRTIFKLRSTEILGKHPTLIENYLTNCVQRVLFKWSNYKLETNEIYDHSFNGFFCQKLEALRYTTTIVITEVFQGVSQEKLFEELGLEIRKSRRWLRRLCFMYKLINCGTPKYLLN